MANRVTHAKDFAHTVLPQERELPYQLGVEMDVDQNGNVIYYYDMDDYRYMDSKSFKRNFPKILQQTIHQVGQVKISEVTFNKFVKSIS